MGKRTALSVTAAVVLMSGCGKSHQSVGSVDSTPAISTAQLSQQASQWLERVSGYDRGRSDPLLNPLGDPQQNETLEKIVGDVPPPSTWPELIKQIIKKRGSYKHKLIGDLLDYLIDVLRDDPFAKWREIQKLRPKLLERSLGWYYLLDRSYDIAYETGDRTLLIKSYKAILDAGNRVHHGDVSLQYEQLNNLVSLFGPRVGAAFLKRTIDQTDLKLSTYYTKDRETVKLACSIAARDMKKLSLPCWDLVTWRDDDHIYEKTAARFGRPKGEMQWETREVDRRYALHLALTNEGSTVESFAQLVPDDHAWPSPTYASDLDMLDLDQVERLRKLLHSVSAKSSTRRILGGLLPVADRRLSTAANRKQATRKQIGSYVAADTSFVFEAQLGTPEQRQVADEMLPSLLRTDQSGRAIYLQGRLFQMRGQFEKALEAYREAARIRPNEEGVWYSLDGLKRFILMSKEDQIAISSAVGRMSPQRVDDFETVVDPTVLWNFDHKGELLSNRTGLFSIAFAIEHPDFYE